MKILKIIFLALFLSIFVGNTLPQKPCGDVPLYLESRGKITKPYTILPFQYPETGNITLEDIPIRYIAISQNGGTPIKLVYYVNCNSGEIYDHEPTSQELLGPIVSKIALGVRHWAMKISKVPIYVGYFSVTEKELDELRLGGMEINRTEEYKVHGFANNESIYRIAELDFVTHIGDDTVYTNLTTGTGYTTPKIVVLANSIDYSLASSFFGFLKNNGIEILHTNASNFERFKTEKFIVILGGPDAYEGVGTVVKQVLPLSVQNRIRAKGSHGMYVSTNAWSQGQVVYVVAGSDRQQTKLASEENRPILAQEARIRG